MPGGHGSEWGRVPLAGHSRDRRINFAMSDAPGLANAAGENASGTCRAGIRNRDWDNFLWTSRSHGARYAGRWLEFKTESNAGGKGSVDFSANFANPSWILR